jgi:hypothetical protein
MSLGANFSSGYMNKINSDTIKCGIPDQINKVHTQQCCSKSYIPGSPVAVYPSMLLKSKICPPPTQEQFALYPKVAVPCSVKTAALKDSPCNTNPGDRFSQYRRYQPPTPCLPLPQSANMAGISKPSVKNCN